MQKDVCGLLLSPVTAQAQKQIRKQQNAALHCPPMDHVETISRHHVTPRPEVADSHRLKRFGQESEFSVSSMSRSSLGTLARLLSGFEDGKLLQGVEGSSNLQLFNPQKKWFPCLFFCQKELFKRILWPCLSPEYAI